MPREGTLGCGSVARVTAGFVEAILAALTARQLSEKPLTAHVAREATGVSELVALSRSIDLDGMPRNGTKTPPRAPAIREAIRAS